MFNTEIPLDKVNAMNKNTIMEQIGIEFTEISKDYLTARMPVDHRTHQPFGILHGGASVVLAESLGSVASTLVTNPKEEACVGLEINANHIRSVKEGYVTGKVQALHVGRRTHIWEIKIYNEEDKLVCVSRITIAVIKK
ncbi:MAG: hotdog fold thioesterase [Bacteroidota bacterium]